MTTVLKKFDEVEFVIPPVKGVIVDGTFIDGEPHWVVEYMGADGETNQRPFPFGSLTKVEPAATAAE